MDTIIENAQELPVVATPDVLVVGAGPAGIGAAIAAARSGAKTLLIERYGFIGGNMTIAMVNPMFTFHDRKGRQVIKGIAQEVVSNLIKLKMSDGHITDLTFDNASMTPFDPEGMKICLLRMVKEAGCDMMLHTFVAKTIREGNKVKAVIVENKSGRLAIVPKTVIDCSADADVSTGAGCEFVKGRKQDGIMQPVTLYFRMGGIDNQAMRAWMKNNRDRLKGSPTDEEIDSQNAIAFLGMNDILEKAVKEGNYPEHAASRILFYQLPHKDQISVNSTRLQGIDGTNVHDLTRAEVETREQAWGVYLFLKKSIGGFENSYILDTGVQVGIRETRHIVGDFELSKEDVLRGAAFEDGIACGTFAIDIHPPEGKKQIFTGSGHAVYEIPYRCLLPKGVDNLWVAGRCISATHEAFGSSRVMATCMAIGQGAGTAAAYSIKHNLTSREVDPKVIRASLIEQGQYLLRENLDELVDEQLVLDREDTDGEVGSHHNPFQVEK